MPFNPFNTLNPFNPKCNVCVYIYIYYLYIYHPAQIPSTSRQPISWTWKPPLVVWWTSLEDSWPHEKHIESTALWSQASRFDGALLQKRRGKNSDFRFGVFSLNALFSPIWNLHTLTRDTFHDNFSHGSPNSLSREPKEELVPSVSRIGRLPVFQFPGAWNCRTLTSRPLFFTWQTDTNLPV